MSKFKGAALYSHVIRCAGFRLSVIPSEHLEGLKDVVGEVVFETPQPADQIRGFYLLVIEDATRGVDAIEVLPGSFVCHDGYVNRIDVLGNGAPIGAVISGSCKEIMGNFARLYPLRD